MSKLVIIGVIVLATLSGIASANIQGDMSLDMVYGTDDRYNVNNYKDQRFKDYARSVAGSIHKSSVMDIGGLTTLFGQPLSQALRLCSDQKFYEQISTFDCSGFLVGPDTLITAGHCISRNYCRDYVWIFDYTESDQVVNPNNIYGCKEVLKSGHDKNSLMDFAIIRLDRKVYDREPLEVRMEGAPEVGAEIVMIGYPSGLPEKIADNASITGVANHVYLKTNVDSFFGNSGSPIINKDTGLVEGILVRGEKDYYKDHNRGCAVSHKCEGDDCIGEDATRITAISNLIAESI